MIDTHAHLFVDNYQTDLYEVLLSAFENGISKIIIPAIEPKSFDKVLTTAAKDQRLYCSIGVHPHNASEVNDEVLTIIERNSQNPKVVAIGEIGLDYYYDFNPPDVQKKSFY